MPHPSFFTRMKHKLHLHHHHKVNENPEIIQDCTFVRYGDESTGDIKASILRDFFANVLCKPKDDKLQIDYTYSTYFNLQPPPYGIDIETALGNFKKRYIAQYKLAPEILKEVISENNLFSFWHGKAIPNTQKIEDAKKILNEHMVSVHVDVLNEKYQSWERAHTYTAAELQPSRRTLHW